MNILQIFKVWPKCYCHVCKKRVWVKKLHYASFFKSWRAQCKSCYSFVPEMGAASIKVGADGVHSKRFMEKHRGSVPDKIKEKHFSHKRDAAWRKTANAGGRIGYRGDGTTVK